MVPSFKEYNLDDQLLVEPHCSKPPSNIFSVLQKFDPCEDDIDRRVLYEITGTPISNDKYWDTSDEDTDDNIELDKDKVIDSENPNSHLKSNLVSRLEKRMNYKENV